jgi:molybdopterin converting factor small subunit
VKVRIPTPLRSYTAEARSVEANGTTLDEVLVDLDRRHPGLRFRVVDEQGRLRPHMRIFVNDQMTRDLATPVTRTDEITLMQALSGG